MTSSGGMREFKSLRGRVGALIANVALMGLAYGAAMPLIALRLAEAGYSPTIVGLNASTTTLAILFMAPLLPGLGARIGVMTALYAAIFIGTATLLLFPAFESLSAWFALRALFGIGIGVHWVVSEAWVNIMAPEALRGRMIALYITFMAGGFALGPLVLDATGIAGWAPFAWAALAMAASVIPLFFIHSAAPDLPRQPVRALWAMARAAPAAVCAACLAGAADNAVIVLLPLYGIASGLPADISVQMLSAFVAGSVLLQLPLGWLADRADRTRVLIGAGFAAGLGALLLVPATQHPALLWPLLFVWGGLAIGLYTLSLSLLGQRVPASLMANGSAAFVTAYNAGNLIGPVAGGGAMDFWGPAGLSAVAAVMYGSVGVIGLAALRWRPPNRLDRAARTQSIRKKNDGEPR